MAWRKEDREAFRLANPDYAKEHYQKHAQLYKERARENYQNNKERRRKAQLKWNQKNKEKLETYSREWHQKRRKICIDRLGGKCTCCGESHYVFLAIDHINNDGWKIRRPKGPGRISIYAWLIRNDFPSGFQILCHNCNMAKAILGKCPHGF